MAFKYFHSLEISNLCFFFLKKGKMEKNIRKDEKMKEERRRKGSEQGAEGDGRKHVRDEGGEMEEE